MGNIILPSNGIIKKGEQQELTCEKCNLPFNDYVGTITIKGPSPTPTKCKFCKQKELQEFLKTGFQPQRSDVQEHPLPKE